MELCRTSLFICFKSMKWRQFSSKHSLERALNSLQSNWLFQPKFSISRDSALANILRICSDITHDSQYFRNVDFSCPTVYIYTFYVFLFITVGTCRPWNFRFLDKGIVFCAGDCVVPLVEIFNKSVVVGPRITDVHHWLPVGRGRQNVKLLLQKLFCWRIWRRDAMGI